MATKTNAKSFKTMRTTKNVKRFVWVFLVIAIIITIIISYQALFKSTVAFTRAEYPVEATFATTIDTEPAADELAGEFKIETLNHSASTTNFGEKQTIYEKASGTIRVINNWSQDQPLQATTRFLAPDGTLFRTTERVDVPAGGEVTVPVVADEKGSSGGIAAGTQFTIPGLWEGLQDKIYGVNDEAFSTGERTVMLVTQNDIDKLQKQVLDEIDEEAKKQYRTDDSSSEQYIVRTQIISQQPSAQVGSEAETLSYAVKAEYAVVSIRTQALSALAYDKLALKMTDQEQITRLLLDDATMDIDRLSTTDNSIQARFTIHAFAELKDNATVFQPIYLQNKTAEDLSKLQEQEIGIEKIDVSFSPFWSHALSSDTSRIKVTIQ